MHANEEQETIIRKASFDPVLCAFGMMDGGQIRKYEYLKYGDNPLGRAAGSTIKLTEKSISRKHATVNYDAKESAYYYTHLNQRTESFVKLEAKVDYQMIIGDVLEIGSNEFKVTNYQQGKICELIVIMGMRNYLERKIVITKQQGKVVFGRSSQHAMIYFDLDKTLSKTHGTFFLG